MLTIDEANHCIWTDGVGSTRIPFDSPEAFDLISRLWLRVGWDNKHVYTFTWMGRPVIQLPEDMLRLQELVFQVQPDVIIETGIAHGGGLIFYASLCKLMGKGRVVGIDVDLRSHNRAAIENHDLYEYITLLSGSSTDVNLVAQVRDLISPTDTVMVFLDSNHSKDHVLKELTLYSPFVSKGAYIIAMDGIMSELGDAPRTKPDWKDNNPREAARQFVQEHPDFQIVEPPFLFNESSLKKRISYSPDGIIQRIR